MKIVTVNQNVTKECKLEIASKTLPCELSGNPEIKSGILIGACLLTNIRKIPTSYEFTLTVRKKCYLFIDIFFIVNSL